MPRPHSHYRTEYFYSTRRLFGPPNLSTETNHGGTTCLRAVNSVAGVNKRMIVSSGNDGIVRVRDGRTGAAAIERTHGIRPRRSEGTPAPTRMTQFRCTFPFSLLRPHDLLLLSGSTDGLLCVSNADEEDEDEGVVYVDILGSSISQASSMHGGHGYGSICESGLSVLVGSDEHLSLSPIPIAYNTLPLSDAQGKTIYALSKHPKESGVAITLISGPDALRVWQRMIRPTRATATVQDPSMPERTCTHTQRQLRRVTSSEVNERGVMRTMWINSPVASERGGGGGPQKITERASSRCSAVCGSTTWHRSSFHASVRWCCPALRIHRRAYEGGRLDLTQAERLQDLMDAERRNGLPATRGAPRRRGCLALIEALIDFGEGEEIEEGVFEEGTIDPGDRRGEIMNAGIRLAIFGPPNVSKSSLSNFLARRRAAIVTSYQARQFKPHMLRFSYSLVQMPITYATPSGPRLEIPSELAPLVTHDTLILLNKPDLYPTPALPPAAALADALTQRSWAVSLTSQAGTGKFLAGIATALQDRCGDGSPSILNLS
ncbi:hypothetical protein F5148DRAFT_1145902 [Russula earlei]|uniref:Uncharacterized protein n=1 Tax=Russula earlei TaxID=71964 RepID=A0ACC0UPD7_9AGAM|nr:hypothetical protein F5148DRAFT_1145902 [Russula earlei]